MASLGGSAPGVVDGILSQVLTKGPGSWMEVPITDIAIARVEALAKQEGQPLLQDSNLLVEWRPNQPFDEDDEYDEDYETPVDGDEYDIDLEVDDETEGGDDDGDVAQEFPVPDLPAAGPDPGLITQPPVEDETRIGTNDETGMEDVGAGTGIVEEEGAAHVAEEGAGHVEEEGAGTDVDDRANDPGDIEETAQGGRYNLWPNRSREYSHLFDSQTYNVTNAHC